jgi:hypothetical protein
MFRWFGLAVILSVCPVLSSSDLSQQEEARRQKETRKTQHGKYGGTDDPPTGPRRNIKYLSERSGEFPSRDRDTPEVGFETGD